MATFRNAAWNLSPARLRTETAARLVYSFIGIPLDMIAEAADQAVKARFPMLAPEDALNPIGRDRVIVRGPNEPSSSYRERLLLWLVAWSGAGVGRAMLDQIAGLITPHKIRMRIWTQTGMVYTREPDASFVIERVPAGLWNWDGQPDLWARFWVVLYSVGGIPWSRSPVMGTPGHFIGEDPTATIGSTAKATEVRTIRGIIDEWKPAKSKCVNVIISFDANAFAPTDASPPLPAGTWFHYWDTPSLASNRDPRGIYWKGV
jgi:hypothetical protein